MKFKLAAWQIFTFGILGAFLIGYLFFEEGAGGSFAVTFMIYGGIATLAYYIIFKWVKKKKKKN